MKKYLEQKLKVNSRFGIDLLLGKSVGSRGFFHFDPTPLDICRAPGRELLIVLPYGNPPHPLLEELKKIKKNF